MRKKFLAVLLSMTLLVTTASIGASADAANPAIKLDFTGYTVHGTAESTAVVGEDLSVKVTNANVNDGGIRKDFDLSKVDLTKTPYLYFDIKGTQEEGVNLMIAAANSLNGTGGDFSMEENLIAWTALTTDGVKQKIKIADLAKLKLDNGGKLQIQLRFSGKATTVEFNGIYLSDEEFAYDGATFNGETLTMGEPEDDKPANPAYKLSFSDAEERNGVKAAYGEDHSITLNYKDATDMYAGIVKTFSMEKIDLDETPYILFDIAGGNPNGIGLMIDVTNSLQGTDGDWTMTCEELRWITLPEGGGTYKVNLKEHPELKLEEKGDLTIALMFNNETDKYTEDGEKADIKINGVYMSDEKFEYGGKVYDGTAIFDEETEGDDDEGTGTTQPPATNPEDKPTTGESGFAVIVAGMFLTAAAAAVASRKRRV